MIELFSSLFDCKNKMGVKMNILNKKLLISLTALMLTVVGPANAEKLRVGMECTYAPFNFKTADGVLSGYDVDVSKGVAEILGLELEYVCQKWDGMIPALLANKFDLIIASMSITDKRKKKIDFSGPYRDSVGQMVARKDLGRDLFDSAGKPDAAAFKGIKVGLERATTYSDWFEQTLPSAKVVLYDSNEALYLDLLNGRTDVIMTNPMKAHLKFLSKDGNDGFELAGPVIDDVAYFGVGVGIGLRQGQEELRDNLTGALKTLIKNGSLKEYALKYFPFQIHNDKWAD
jgi:polar amino acid transport system substrate-binding protein